MILSSAFIRINQPEVAGGGERLVLLPPSDLVTHIPCKARQTPNPQTSHLSCQQGSPPRGGALETKMLSKHELCGHHWVSLCRSLMFPFSSPPSPVMGRVTDFCSDSVRHLGPMLTHPRNPRSWRYLPEHHNKFHSLFVYFKFVC